ncbi:alcohol dehydrogenase family protein [Vacuolonema iberomarrocanum]|uniref:alcohol dehydrogenase family protein n=1 Tax=Vacuolonema iberomarrocanum TaxID=3454632 RepID=UPI0019F25192|nr:alcohol dehydrogenase family protein [filamentous cyanobacterium LEGE 07170]
MTNLPKLMRGVWLTGHGEFDKLEVRNDIPVPQPEHFEVLIRVSAAAVNNTDVNTRIAWYSKSDGASEDASWSGVPLQFPRIQGIDACGQIVAVGKGVSPERIGERVLVEPCIREANGVELERPWFFGSECNGGFADYTVVAARHAHKITSNYSDIELASFPCSYSTAENLLTRAAVGVGDRVLITGASGGVGSAAIQLAKARNAEVIAVTSPSKSNALLDLGATQTLTRHDSVTQSLGHNTIDVVVDLVAGEQWPEFLDVLRPKGRYAVAGAIGGSLVELDVRTLYLKDLSFFGCTILEPQVFPNLIQAIERESIRPLVAQTFPLPQIVEAQKAFLAKKHIGKIVLTLSDA